MIAQRRALVHRHRRGGAQRSRTLTTAVVLLVGLLCSAGTDTAAASTADVWASTYGDAGNSMNNPGERAITATNAGSLRPAWTSTLNAEVHYAPAVAGGVAYRVIKLPRGDAPASLTATSARTGATLWSMPLVYNEPYVPALTVVGHYLLAPFYGNGNSIGTSSDRGGLSLVDLQTRRIVWTSYQPPVAIDWLDDREVGAAYSDGTRIYQQTSSYQLVSYRFSDGALLWKVPLSLDAQGGLNSIDGVVIGHGVVYTTGGEGLIARDAVSGRRLWGAAGITGQPVLAGGHVYGMSGSRVAAFPEAGCGAATCQPLWTTDLGPGWGYYEIGGADATTLFATNYQRQLPGKAATGYVVRLAAATGKILWAATPGRFTIGLVRGGNTIWFYNPYVGSDHGEYNRILGYSATASTATPLRTIPLGGTNYEWFPQHLAIAAGTLFEQANGPYLVGYRIPGT